MVSLALILSLRDASFSSSCEGQRARQGAVQPEARTAHLTPRHLQNWLGRLSSCCHVEGERLCGGEIPGPAWQSQDLLQWFSDPDVQADSQALSTRD